VFKAPNPVKSLLGLDTLARQKRMEQGKAEPPTAKRMRLFAAANDGDEDEAEGNGQASAAATVANADASSDRMPPPQQRHFRGQRIETPSRPGGVNEEAARAQQERRKERIRASQHASTTGRGDERGSGRGASDRDRHHSSSSSHDRQRDDQQNGRRDDRRDDRRTDRRDDRRERAGSRSGRDERDYRERSSSRPVDRGGWEASTPRRSGGPDEWETTPAAGRSQQSPSPWTSRGGDTPVRGGSQTPSRGWGSGSAWNAKSGGLTPVRPGGSGASALPQRSSVRFAGPNASPALTPSWKSNAWAGKAGLAAGGREESPELKPDTDGLLSEEWEQNEKQLDRDWYDREEGGGGVDETHDPFLGDEATFQKLEEKQKQEAQRQKHLTRRDGSQMSLAQSKRHSEVQKDINAWEENRLLTSGVVRARENDLDFDGDADQRTVLVVHDTMPPFLDGRVRFTKQADLVLPLKDASSDMAVISRNGSALVKEVREKKEKGKSRARFWELAGSKMGKVTGLTEQEVAEGEAAKKALEEEAGQADGDGSDDENFKKANQFGIHMSKKTDAVSKFATENTILEQRKLLPVYDVRDELLQVIRENQVVVIVGETGSGKTTQLTQYLHEDGYTTVGMVGCTQPRRVAAMSVAKRVSEEMECELGKQVGYAIRFEDCTGPETVIKYMTDGVLLRETLREEDLDAYTAIIMDEAHERSLNTDVLFGILKKVVARRRDFKLIVTSATLNATKFSDFFARAPVFNIPGRTFPVDVLFSKTPQEDYVEAAVKQAIAIHLGHPEGDILIFMTGQEEIEATCFALKERLEALGDGVPDLLILPIYSQLPSDLQAKIFDKAPEGSRKCIVSTNIAETSLTVDGIIYVIDTGYVKMKVYNPKMGMDALQVYPESRAAASQRSGRAGRTGPGTCWRLFTEAAFRYEMLETNVPEIQRTNLGNTVLLLKSLNVDNLLEFDFMDPPPQDNILNSMYQLWVLNALDNTGGLTKIGRKMVEFPLDPPLAKMLLIGSELGCSSEVLTLVSMLSVPSVFFRPPDRAEESDAAREKFFVPESDHLTLLHVYQQWKNNGYRADWCSDHFLQPKGLRKAKEVRAQLLDIMQQQKVPINSCGHDWDIVRKAICSAYFHNAAKLKGIGEYINCRSGMPCFLHPTSALYGLGYTPDYIAYHELVFTSKEYMQCVTAVDPEWLAELGPMFFSVKEKNTAARQEQRRKEREAAAAMEVQMAAAEATKAAANAEAAAAAASVRERQRAAIATPGRRTPAHTPRRTYGL